MMRFLTTCVDCQGENINRLNTMIEKGVEITRRTFLKRVDRDELQKIEQQLGYEMYGSRGLTMSADCHVSYFKSKWDEKSCVYFVWSAIEYIFKD